MDAPPVALRGRIPGRQLNAWLPLLPFIAAVLLSVAVALATAPMPGDQPVAEAVQAIPGLHGVARVVNVLAGAQWEWAVAAALLGAVARSRGTLMPPAPALLTVFGLALPLLFADNLLKVIVRSPRPDAASGLRITDVQTTFGFPSGHVFGAVLALGLLAWVGWYALPRRAALGVIAAALAIVLLAGPSRISVGAHWPSDVLGGYLWGGAVLTGLLLVARRIPPWWARRVG